MGDFVLILVALALTALAVKDGHRVPGEVPFCAGRSAVAHPATPMCAEDDGWMCPVCGEFEPLAVKEGQG